MALKNIGEAYKSDPEHNLSLPINAFRHTDLYKQRTAAEISTILFGRKREAVCLHTGISA